MPRRALIAQVCVAVTALVVACPCRAAEPTVQECLSANESAISLRKGRKLRAAREQLLTCAAASCPADIRNECVRRVDEVNASLPSVVFQANDSAGSDLTEVRVTMDGAPFADKLEGDALVVDPGPHTFHFESGAYKPVDRSLVVQEGGKARHERIVFAAPDTGSATGTNQSKTAAADTTRARKTYEILALSSAGVGLVGLGIGTAFGLKSVASHNSASAVCPSDCDSHGVELWDQARSAGNIATVGFAVGAAGIAGAAVLWFVARPSAEPGPSAALALGLGNLQLRGNW